MGNGTLVKSFTKSLIKSLNKSFEANSPASSEKVYAIIYGALTESPEGVFSGFSNSNYLLIEKQLPEEVTEIQIEFTQPSTIATTGTQAIINAGVFSISMYQKKVSVYGGTSPRDIILADDATPNSTYTIKAIKEGNKFTFSYAKDGGSFTEALVWTSNQAYTNNIRIGNSTVSGRGWKGSINMNNTYIKIDDKIWFDGSTKAE